MRRRMLHLLAPFLTCMLHLECFAESFALTRIDGSFLSGVDRLRRMIVLTNDPVLSSAVWDAGVVSSIAPGIWTSDAAGVASGPYIGGPFTPPYDPFYMQSPGAMTRPMERFVSYDRPTIKEFNSRANRSVGSARGSWEYECFPGFMCASDTARPAYWDGTEIHMLQDAAFERGSLDAGGAALGINDRGEMVGYIFRDSGKNYGVSASAVWSPSGDLTVLGSYPGREFSVLHDITNDGVVTGAAFDLDFIGGGGNMVADSYEPFVFSNGRYQPLDFSPADFFNPLERTFEINANGQISGIGVVGGFGRPQEPFLITPIEKNGERIWFDPINDPNGAVVNGRVRFANDLIPASPEVNLNSAYINDSGLLFGGASATMPDSNPPISTGVLMTPFTKFKQFHGPWASEPMGDQKEPPYSIESKGCVLAALATIATYYGNTVDPLTMRDHILANSDMYVPYTDKDGHGIIVAPDRFDFQNEGLFVYGLNRPSKNKDYRGLETIVEELRAGRPVLLAVPSASAKAKSARRPDDNELHYVVAYGLDLTIGPEDDWTPADIGSRIFIADPGNGDSYYGSHGDVSAVEGWMLDEEKVNITLEKYFVEVNRYAKDGAEYSVYNWFGSGDFKGGVFKRDSAEITIEPWIRLKFITQFHIAENGQSFSRNPQVKVRSPVELRISDPETGASYTSSEDIARPGDLVLGKILFDLTTTMDGEDGADSILLDDAFPPYTLDLPLELLGKSLDIEIIGVGDGEYEIALSSGSKQFQSSVPLTGQISIGERLFGRFSVTEVPEISSNLLAAIVVCMVDVRRLRRFTMRQAACPRRSADAGMSGAPFACSRGREAIWESGRRAQGLPQGAVRCDERCRLDHAPRGLGRATQSEVRTHADERMAHGGGLGRRHVLVGPRRGPRGRVSPKLATAFRRNAAT